MLVPFFSLSQVPKYNLLDLQSVSTLQFQPFISITCTARSDGAPPVHSPPLHHTSAWTKPPFLRCLQGNTSVRLLTAIPMFLRVLKAQPDSDKIAVAFPDEGAYKRFSKPFHSAGYYSIICGKERKDDGSR